MVIALLLFTEESNQKPRPNDIQSGRRPKIVTTRFRNEALIGLLYNRSFSFIRLLPQLPHRANLLTVER